MCQHYDSAVQTVNDFLEKNGMSKTVRKYFRHDAKFLKEYLERLGVEYSASLAQSWLMGTRQSLSRIAYLSLRRSLNLIDEAARNGAVNRWRFVYEGGNTRYKIPERFRNILAEYLARRAKEGCRHSTLQMDAIACTRFLLFLESRKIDNVACITPEIIKAYHVQALHRTHEGKNGYTYRIRGFVRFLAEQGHVPITLDHAFSTEKAARVSIVSILSSAQVAAIRSYSARSATPSELRSSAMALLALRIGLRSIDICGLRLSDISWETAIISIVQRKTGSPLSLPLPVEVGNALARYILEGRPSCDIPNVFITLKHPHTSMTVSPCYRATIAILGKKMSVSDVRGLHVARRTFASGLLVASNPISMISHVLGHSSRSSVDEYLATDQKRMRQCAIGLTGIGSAGAPR